MVWDIDNLTPVESLLFNSRLAKVGRFQCAAEHPCFARTAPLDNDVFAFTRRPVWWRRGAGDYRFVEPGGILLHRAGSEVERRAVSGAGDHADWFGVHPEVFVEALQRHRLSTEDMGDALVAEPLLRHRLTVLVNQLAQGEVEQLEAEETVLILFDAICADRADIIRRTQGARSSTAARRRRIVDRARAFLDAHLTENIGLEVVAKAAGASLFHLCRIFREETGLTLHAYRTRQRLGRAVECMAEDRSTSLTELALDLGFSSHSHFSRVFRQQVGVPPSALRA